MIKIKTNDEEATEYELYCYHKGMMFEYMTNVIKLMPDEIQALDNWLLEGGSVHNNPWGLYDSDRRKPVDFVIAYRVKTQENQ